MEKIPIKTLITPTVGQNARILKASSDQRLSPRQKHFEGEKSNIILTCPMRS